MTARSTSFGGTNGTALHGFMQVATPIIAPP